MSFSVGMILTWLLFNYFEHVERITKQSIYMFGGAAIPVSRRKLSNILGLNST